MEVPVLNTLLAGSWPAPASSPHSLTGYYWTHLLAPVLLAVTAGALLMYAGGDQWLADRIYRWGGGAWNLRAHFFTAKIIHPGGRYLSLALWLGFAWAWWRSGRDPQLIRWRRPLAFLLLSTLLATSLIALLKAQIQMDCAWDVLGYGGQRPFLGLFQSRPSWLPDAGCFPAGHAGAGYSWVALYFFFAATMPKWRWRGLAVGLTLGLVFGLSQQLRGAHFASHDVATLLVCWLVALTLGRLMLRPARRDA